jgi:predicted esterase
MRPFAGRDTFSTILDSLMPNMEVKLEVHRKGGKESEVLKVGLGTPTDFLPDAISGAASHRKAREKRNPVPVVPLRPEDQQPKGPEKQRGKPRPKGKIETRQKTEGEESSKTQAKKPKKVETGLVKRTTPTHENEYWLYVPENYDPNVSHALVVWLHPAGSRKEKDSETEQLIGTWSRFCIDRQIIMLCPKAETDSGWQASESDVILQIVRDCLDEYTIDRERVVAHGMGVGGEMAFYLGFHAPDLIRGIATTGAFLTKSPKDNQPGSRLTFFLVAGKSDPASAAIADTKTMLVDRKYPVTYREMQETGREYLDQATLEELVRWNDSLDRQ